MISAPIAAMTSFFLDTIFGDPQSRWHPVAVLGRMIAWLEHILYPDRGTDRQKFAAGALLTSIVLCIYYIAAE